MKTSEILTTEKSKAVETIAKELSQYKAYQQGLQNAQINAEKRYNHEIRMHTIVRRWWKVRIMNNGNIVLWTNNSQEIVLICKDGSVSYNDDLIGNSDIHYAARCAGVATYLLGTRKEIIEKCITGDFRKDGKSNLMPPIHIV